MIEFKRDQNINAIVGNVMDENEEENFVLSGRKEIKSNLLTIRSEFGEG